MSDNRLDEQLDDESGASEEGDPSVLLAGTKRAFVEDQETSSHQDAYEISDDEFAESEIVRAADPHSSQEKRSSVGEDDDLSVFLSFLNGPAEDSDQQPRPPSQPAPSQPSTSFISGANHIQVSGVYPELTQERLASPIEIASIVGETLCDDYRILGKHGEGDLTQVYIGREIASGRLVAIKRLKVLTPKAIELFARAIQNLGKLQHPNIVQSIAYLESPSGEPVYVMECVEDGISLEELLQNTGMIEEEDVVASILIQIADAVEFAHQQSVIHGGLKPSNIMLLQGDEKIIVKVLDFGMERLRVANRALASSYFAPEQVTAGTVSSKSDIYSLGVLAYQMLTGNLPYDGSVDGISQLKQGQKPEDWQPLYVARPQVSCIAELSQLLDEALEVDPQWRMSSMGEFKQGIINWLQSIQELDFEEDEDSGSEEHYAPGAAIDSGQQLPVQQEPVTPLPIAQDQPVAPTSGGYPSGGRDWSTETLEIPIEEDPLEMFGPARLNAEPELQASSQSEAMARLNSVAGAAPFRPEALDDDEFQTFEMDDEEERTRIDQPPEAPSLDQAFRGGPTDAGAQAPVTIPMSQSGQQMPASPIPMPPPPPPKQRPEPEQSVPQPQLEHLQVDMIDEEAVEAEGSPAPARKKKRKRLSKRRGQNVRSTITKLVALKHTEFSQDQTLTMKLTTTITRGPRESPRKTFIKAFALLSSTLIFTGVCVFLATTHHVEIVDGFRAASHFMSVTLLGRSYYDDPLEQEISKTNVTPTQGSRGRLARKRPALPDTNIPSHGGHEISRQKIFKYEESPDFSKWFVHQTYGELRRIDPNKPVKKSGGNNE